MKLTALSIAITASLSFSATALADAPLPGPVTDTDYYDDGAPDTAKVELGKALYWDKLLSGNKNISCATCHHSLTDTGDGLSLPVGEGGNGLGIARDTGIGADEIVERVPRNAPPVFNLGAKFFTRLFHDGRVEVDDTFPSGVKSPAGHNLPDTLDNPLAVQAMFPVTSHTEMAGQPGENPIANAGSVVDVWNLLADRLKADANYPALFIATFDDIDSAADITYAHAVNAIAAYEATAFRADNSPFDHYLRGDKQAMSPAAKRGMQVFYGKGGCGSCHSGKFQTDLQYHAIAVPQIGPGRGDRAGGVDDFGREQVTGDIEDRYRFRTPTLRNVALTGPWGHDGAFNTLEAMVEHHLDPVYSLENYDKSQAVLPSRPDLDAHDFVAYDNLTYRTELAAENELAPVELSEEDKSNLMTFLHALTDPASVDIRATTPASVPSGLPLAD